MGVEGAVGQPVHQLDHIPVLDAVDGLLYGRKHTAKGLKKRNDPTSSDAGPDPLVRGVDPNSDPAPDPDPSIIKQK